MAQTNLVVAHFVDGKVLKGTTQDFSPTRAQFHVLPTNGAHGVSVPLARLKAVFFVKNLDGDAGRIDVRGFVSAPAEAAQGKKLAIRFPDSELICGYAQSYSTNRPGFFIFPADAASNNERVFVIAATAIEVCEGPNAEALANRVLGTQAA